MIKKIVIFSMIAFMAMSCTKSDTSTTDYIYEGHKYSWREDWRFSANAGVIVNSFASDTKLNLSLSNRWATLDKNDKYAVTTKFEHYLNYSTKRKIPITEKIFAFYSDKQQVLSINSTGFLWAETLPEFHLPTYDSEFLSLNDDYIGRKNTFMAISDDMYCLVPYLTTSYQPKFFIIKPDYHWQHGAVHLDANTDSAIVKTVSPAVPPNASSVYFITSYYHAFFVNLGHELFHIDSLGLVKKVLDKDIHQMVQLSDSLVAFGTNNQTYLSVDQGNTWQAFLNIPETNFIGTTAADYNFERINQHIIAYPKHNTGKLYHVYIKDNMFRADTIASDGVDKKNITSIAAFNNKVYVTTLSGLFYKDKEELLR